MIFGAREMSRVESSAAIIASEEGRASAIFLRNELAVMSFKLAVFFGRIRPSVRRFFGIRLRRMNPLDRLRPCVAVFGAPCWRERVVSYEDI